MQTALMQVRTTPHPGCFEKRGCKLLKTKNGRWKKRAKRRQMLEKNEFATPTRSGKAPTLRAQRKARRFLRFWPHIP
jgi:hypothetical protein